MWVCVHVCICGFVFMYVCVFECGIFVCVLECGFVLVCVYLNFGLVCVCCACVCNPAFVCVCLCA